MSYHRPYRGRAQGRGGPRTLPSSNLPPDRDLMQGLSSTPLQRLAKPIGIEGKDIQIKDLTGIGSYNWIESSKPTIIVPGSPRVWTEKSLPYRVALDSGIRFVDQNGYRLPSSTLLPLFRATDEVAAESGDAIDWSGVDFVTDRNNLRKLLRWINDDAGSLKDFRIDIQLAGEHTILFSRWEKRTREDLNKGYGFNFERASSVAAPGCERGTGHHRIVKYDFDGLTMVVRFEVDACLPTGRAAAATTKATPTSTANTDDLSDLLSGLALSPSSSSGATPAAGAPRDDPNLNIIHAGSRVPEDSIVELTTRSAMNVVQFDWGDAYPQLYLSQTPHHFLAIHDRGTFHTITKRKLGDPALMHIESSAKIGFKKLRKALQEIRELVFEQDRGIKLSLVCKDGALKVFERTSDTNGLPESVLKRFQV